MGLLRAVTRGRFPATSQDAADKGKPGVGWGGRGGALSFLLQAPSSPEPHWPPRVRSESPVGPPGGLEPSLQAFQGTCVLFVSFHYHSHSGESKHKQTNLTTRRCRWGGKGDIYVYVQLLQRDRQRCFELSREEQFPSGRGPLWGCGGLITSTWG